MRRLPLEVRWREADDGTTDRPPLVFVHGICAGAWVWERWAEAAAARGWRSAAVSLRGHGDSAGHERLERWRIRDYVDDVRGVLHDLGEPAVLVGHSMGTIVVRRLLAERASVSAAVLVTPVGARHGAGITALLARRKPWQLLRSLALQPVRFDASDQLSPTHPPADADEIVAQLQDESPLVQLELALTLRPRGGDAPVLVLGAGSDHLVPPVEAVRTARLYGGDCVMFARMGHLVMLDTGWHAPATRMLDWLEERHAVRG